VQRQESIGDHVRDQHPAHAERLPEVDRDLGQGLRFHFTQHGDAIFVMPGEPGFLQGGLAGDQHRLDRDVPAWLGPAPGDRVRAYQVASRVLWLTHVRSPPSDEPPTSN
jgi:hypothetical protein